MTSSFTLSSGMTDDSSASSQLKKLYYSISALETKILNEDSDDHLDKGRVLR
ncbi:hypothetical protein AZE42_12054 [Rhizopogon vesiculosus]|uniref:Uncharacterized protein n=1 Tax=Rhizopogon vesiculosus TaxID=180088 RepID=A0A1J8PNC1_9AGAM|nr:hypothetical protein AZE42_12054 [Rhizopogon vesiculosus]